MANVKNAVRPCFMDLFLSEDKSFSNRSAKIIEKEIITVKTQEELNALKEEIEALKEKLAELSEEELERVAGGYIPPHPDK